MSGSGFSRLSIVFGLAALLSACSSNLLYTPHTVERHGDAGAFTVAATMVATWDNFVDTLSPNFALTETDAVSAAIPRSTITERQMLDALAVALQVAPPTSAVSETATDTLSADGTTERTGTKTTTREAGDASEATAPQAPSTSLQQQGATKLPANAGDSLKIDPFLKYTVAGALYQEVRLLNNAVRAAARRHNMVPYILRLQLNNVPFARHQPYDTYAMVSMFSRRVCAGPLDKPDDDCRGFRDSDGKFGWRDGEAVVVPLLVTDNLESLLASQSSNVVRQFAAAASILQGGFAAALGLTRRTEELDAVLANDLNSLMTVGRPTNSSLYVRLGAMQEATARYAMVPRNYSITALVLVPEDSKPGGAIDEGDIEGIRITGSLKYRNAETGVELPREASAARDGFVKDVVKEIAGTEVTFGPNSAADLRVALYVNDYAWFSRTASGLTGPNGEKNPIKATADLWNALLERNISTGFFGADVHLPKQTPPQYPPQQSVLLIDDGTNGARAVLRGGGGLSARTLGASLTIPLAGGGDATLAATEVAVERQGADPALVFPSFAAWKIKPVFAGPDSALIPGAKLRLHALDRNGYDRKTQAVGGADTYSTVLYRLTGKTDGVMVRLSKTVHSIKADESQKASFRVYVEFLPGADGKLPDSVELIPDGGDLASAAGTAAGTLSVTLGKAVLKASDSVTLNFERLAKSKPVKVRAVTMRDGRVVGAEPAAVEVAVE